MHCSLYVAFSAWRLRKCRARKVCDRLGIAFVHPAYYRDVVCWLPGMQFGDAGRPRCKKCKGSDKVAVHAIRMDHPGRRVVDIEDHYFIVYVNELLRLERACCSMLQHVACCRCSHVLTVRLRCRTARYICHRCKADQRSNYTFMGWDQWSLAHMPQALGDIFPAFLTTRAAVDKRITSLMRCGLGVIACNLIAVACSLSMWCVLSVLSVCLCVCLVCFVCVCLHVCVRVCETP